MLAFFLFLCYASLALSLPEVQLGTTKLVGSDLSLSQLEFFGGIPYAEPPLGALRLQPPVLKTDLEVETFNASEFDLACLQAGLPIDAISEDCLTINVLRPSGTFHNASLPVLFWIHGGSYYEGSASLYDGSTIVTQSVLRATPVIYVNFNYRLGPLGFPQATDREKLNLGLKDQLAALEWVQHNIGAFGGDKNKVTVFGESVGASMTSILFLHPSISDLAWAGIFESGTASTPPPFNATAREDREDAWNNFVAAIPECSSYVGTSPTFSCVQNASSSEVYEGFLQAYSNTTEKFIFRPTLDGPSGLFPDLPSRLLLTGQFARLPFIAGTNLDEGTLFSSPTQNYTEEVIRSIVNASYSPPAVPTDVMNELMDLYPDDPADGSPYNTGNETFGLSPGNKRISAILGDLAFNSQRRLWSQTTADVGVKSYAYRFAQRLSSIPAYLGVPHGGELPFVFGDVAAMNETASVVALSTVMIDYWLSFATSLDPNDGFGSQRPTWAQYTASDQALLQISADNLTMVPDDFNKEKIDFIISQKVAFRYR
ncbi:extracellular triacylglycerol lipase precursor [Desarmillaria tabescens]|uniref:Extracellular triacylglycerol lipase n=1 Tax=Armillaria tabescens TaxID=1929756 RepID=A0AA39NC02_ARMTA|nr:extracellular triacylglycerol lipase precursor [Desarmillaria tabescens]KAK0462856.1 extracellular triacylglycerol lipase precursor [Desarmillaria tabescens]